VQRHCNSRPRTERRLPGGQISEFAVKPALRKYSPCRVGQISDLTLPVSPEKRGGSRSSRNARWDAVDAAASVRDGIAGRVCPVSDIVSARRRRQCPVELFGCRRGLPRRSPWAKTGRLRTAKACGPGTRCWCQVGGGDVGPTGRDKTFNPPMTVTRRIRRRGERAISRKTIAQGRPDALR
jgi:hypothetical protein